MGEKHNLGPPAPGEQPPGKADESFFRQLSVEFLVHELKDPVAVAETGVRTLLERQDKYGTLTERQQRTLARVLRSCRKARAMLADLLEVGRGQAACVDCRRFSPVRAVRQALVEALELEAVTIYEQVAELEEERFGRQLAACGIDWEPTDAAQAAIMDQDEVKFRQIAANLIRNALRFRHRSMAVRVDCRGGELCLEVSDDGPGIAAQHHRMVFERYRQAQAPSGMSRNGHGLGLAGAQALARCLGGRIRLESAPGKGASFFLTVPLSFQG